MPLGQSPILAAVFILLNTPNVQSIVTEKREVTFLGGDLLSSQRGQSEAYSGVKRKYSEVLGLSWLFYEAQRSGKLPASNRIPWRGDAHINDLVAGGWYDAGDTLKISFPMATSVSFLAWGILQFPQALRETGQYEAAVGNLQWGADYLMRCHISKRRFVGMIGSIEEDHALWDRPEDWQGPRPAYIWNSTSPVADLAGAASAALSSSSLVFKAQGQTAYAARMLRHAEQLYAWACTSQGFYHTAFPGQLVYESSRYHDKLMYAAAWLFKATGRRSFLNRAQRHWREAPGYPYANIYVGYDSVYAPAVNLLLGLQARESGCQGGRDMPPGSTTSFWTAGGRRAATGASPEPPRGFASWAKGGGAAWGRPRGWRSRCCCTRST